MYSECPKNENASKIYSYPEIFNWIILEKDFAEYYAAKQRFHSQFSSTDMNTTEEDIRLDDLIFKLCSDQEILIEIEASLFFRLLFRSDFIQLYKELRDKFYRRICSLFILTDRIEDILKSVNILDLIPHVMSEVFLNLMESLEIKIITKGNCLELKFLSRRTWYRHFDLNKVEHVIVTPAAFKVMLGKFGMNFNHLNFILRLMPLKALTLDGCNLSWIDKGNILNGLALASLSMQACGTSVNRFIQENCESLKQHLRELDVSGCPVYEETLHILSQFKLEKLNIRNCIKSKGYFIDGLWMEKDDLGVPDETNVDINILWSGEKLIHSLKSLDVSSNYLSYNDMKRISHLSISVLNVAFSKQILSSDCCLLLSCGLFLKELRIHDVEVNYSVLTALFGLNLEVLEICYDAVKNLNDFSSLLQKPTSNSLRELTIYIKNHTACFIHFLAKLRLKYFQCKLGTWYYYNFDVFWNDDNRKFLRTLLMEDGKIAESDAFGISRLKLEKLSLCPFLFDSKEHILTILSSTILQHSVNDLLLGGAYEVDIDHLSLLNKFDKLQKLSLKISGNNLTRVFSSKIEHFKYLKELRIKVFIGLNVDEETANALCNLPNGIDLTIVLAGLGRKWPLTFTERAFQIFSQKDPLYNFEIPVHLELSDCTLDHRCGRIFNKFNLKSLVLSSCILDNFFNTFIQGSILFTLEYLAMKRVDVDYRELNSLRNSYLNELSILTENNDSAFNRLPIVLSDGAISKSLCVLTLGPHSRITFVEYLLKCKISVCQSFPS